ncbi:MAG: hypothetical protein WA817_12125 [Candidatus Acidiferrum sp.]
MHLQILPGGCRLEGGRAVAKKRRSGGGLRGSIKGLSQAAAARLRWFLVSHYVPGYACRAVTRTIHRPATADDWRACAKRWRMAVKRRKWAEPWRVELQKRKTPHAHSALWTPEDVTEDEIRDLWLHCTRESGDPEAVAHAVVFGPASGSGSAWTAYLCSHMGKSKAAQLGWKGKQWGIINRHLFEPVPVFELELTVRAATWFARLVRRWASSRFVDKKGRRLRVFTSDRGFARALDGSVVPRLAQAAQLLGGSVLENRPF